MSGAVSGINQAVAIRTEQAVREAHGAIARKRLDAAEAVGQAVVQLIQQAADVGRRVDIRV